MAGRYAPAQTGSTMESASSSTRGWEWDSASTWTLVTRCPSPSVRMIVAETTIETQRYIRPGMNEWVCFSAKPSTYGPTNPPRLPSELIKPMLPAAAASDRIRLGSAQKAGM